MKHLLTFALSICLLGSTDLKGMEQTAGRGDVERKISNYETAHYDLRLSKFEKWSQMKAEIRAFLWDHWYSRRFAKLVVTMYTKEGDPTKSTFLIEPDQSGAWHIQLDEEWVTTAFVLKPRIGKKEFGVYKIERFTKDEKRGGKRVADDAKVAGDFYKLVFKNKNGERVGEW